MGRALPTETISRLNHAGPVGAGPIHHGMAALGNLCRTFARSLAIRPIASPVSNLFSRFGAASMAPIFPMSMLPCVMGGVQVRDSLHRSFVSYEHAHVRDEGCTGPRNATWHEEGSTRQEP